MCCKYCKKSKLHSTINCNLNLHTMVYPCLFPSFPNHHSSMKLSYCAFGLFAHPKDLIRYQMLQHVTNILSICICIHIYICTYSVHIPITVIKRNALIVYIKLHIYIHIYPRQVNFTMVA